MDSFLLLGFFFSFLIFIFILSSSFFGYYLFKVTKVLLKVTTVTTGHQKWPKTAQNSIISSLFCPKGKIRLGRRPKPSAGSRSRPAQLPGRKNCMWEAGSNPNHVGVFFLPTQKQKICCERISLGHSVLKLYSMKAYSTLSVQKPHFQILNAFLLFPQSIKSLTENQFVVIFFFSYFS